ncbi:DUF6233 domain-containing protein [Streptomyces sp. NPDC008150]|uniref:DUF6233 domain-containing protein n=1 Tax=Streptomyces sp. NPDC008150 TaxID=3364816 RepID=UPI0036E28AD2
MSDLPPDLPRLRVLETWLTLSLAEVRQRIAALERPAPTPAPAPPTPEPARPAPAWLLEYRPPDQHPHTVHTGDCWTSPRYTRVATEGQARQAIDEGVERCDVCDPEPEA